MVGPSVKILSVCWRQNLVDHRRQLYQLRLVGRTSEFSEKARQRLAAPGIRHVGRSLTTTSLILWRYALAGAAGIEPANHGIKTRCLTTWLRPNPARREHIGSRPSDATFCFDPLRPAASEAHAFLLRLAKLSGKIRGWSIRTCPGASREFPTRRANTRNRLPKLRTCLSVPGCLRSSMRPPTTSRPHRRKALASLPSRKRLPNPRGRRKAA